MPMRGNGKGKGACVTWGEENYLIAKKKRRGGLEIILARKKMEAISLFDQKSSFKKGECIITLERALSGDGLRRKNFYPHLPKRKGSLKGGLPRRATESW